MEKSNNFVKSFDEAEEIENWLREQWAGFMSEYLKSKETNQTLKEMSEQLADLKATSNMLEEFTKKIISSETLGIKDADKVIKSEEEKLSLTISSIIFSKTSLYITLCNVITDNSLLRHDIFKMFHQSNDLKSFMGLLNTEDILDTSFQGSMVVMSNDSATQKIDFEHINKMYINAKKEILGGLGIY